MPDYGFDRLMLDLTARVRLPESDVYALARSIAGAVRHREAYIEDISPAEHKPTFRWRRGISKGSTFCLVLLEGSGDGVSGDVKFRVRWSDETRNELLGAMGQSVTALLVNKSKKLGGPRGFDLYEAYLEALMALVIRRGGSAELNRSGAGTAAERDARETDITGMPSRKVTIEQARVRAERERARADPSLGQRVHSSAFQPGSRRSCVNPGCTSHDELTDRVQCRLCGWATQPVSDPPAAATSRS
jgi:hypothetical protein